MVLVMDDPDLGRVAWSATGLICCIILFVMMVGCSPLYGSNRTLPPKKPIEYPIEVRCKDTVTSKRVYVFRGGSVREAIYSCLPLYVQ